MPEEPQLPDGASVPQPVTIEQQAATSEFLNWVQDVLAWGRGLQGRAKTAKDTLCGS